MKVFKHLHMKTNKISKKPIVEKKNMNVENRFRLTKVKPEMLAFEKRAHIFWDTLHIEQFF